MLDALLGTSQTCAECGHVAAETRSGVRFACVTCLHVDHADVNAARVILKRAQREPLASRAAVADGNDQELCYRRVDLGSRCTTRREGADFEGLIARAFGHCSRYQN
ncbi:MAG: zinc ribbon domain-containing protein [Vulcanimicrobiaceae bacterium]